MRAAQFEEVVEKWGVEDVSKTRYNNLPSWFNSEENARDYYAEKLAAKADGLKLIRRVITTVDTEYVE